MQSRLEKGISLKINLGICCRSDHIKISNVKSPTGVLLIEVLYLHDVNFGVILLEFVAK